jgi:hypothetical protein
VDEAAVRTILRRLGPAARSDLRRLVVSNQQDRDRVAERLLRRRQLAANQIAELLDFLSLNQDARRTVARLLGEMEARDAR